MKTIRNNEEFFQEIQTLSNELYALGYKHYNESITDALEISTIPGEIFGNIRNLLDSLIQKKLDEKIKERIIPLINYLDSILGPRNYP